MIFSCAKDEDEGETEEEESIRAEADPRGADGLVDVQEIPEQHRQHHGELGGRRLHEYR